MVRPNIVYIHSHDTGRYIQPYGHAIATPNLQRLAEQGVLFRQAFCGNPTCSPSRACLLTGQSAHSNGMVGLAHRGFRLKDYGHHILHTLRKAGYTSVLAGHQHIAVGEDAWQTIGYDRCFAGRADAHERASEFLDSAPEQPFFLTVGFSETHREFPEAHPDDDARYCLPPLPLPDTPDTREDMARFKACARILDRKMGTVFDALDRNGLSDHTLVICTTDHGIAFPRMKCNLADSGIGVMLIMRGPGGFTGGKVIDDLVSQTDIFPTVCDLLGVERPTWLEGVSFLPRVSGADEPARDCVFAEVNYHAAYEPKRCARTARWKYIRRFDARTSPVLPNCDDSLSKTLWMTNGWCEIPPVDEALYDLVFDPGETNNVAGDVRHSAALEEMRARLNHWMAETDDPLLHGSVPAPDGAVVNDPDGVSPRDRPKPVGG